MRMPANFRNDIQGRDTNLVPVIWIGNINPTGSSGWLSGEHYLLSTNATSINWIQGFTSLETITRPILLNIPSLKESIDIEKRNYRISNLTIQLSNYEYNGVRFSELVGENSLINTECRIFWKSPNTSQPKPLDHSGFAMADNDLFQVYYGVIRRYEHDDDKVKLVVEDRSQSKLHRDLPIANLGTEDEVLDKYKNKPIPIVYGKVGRSPCVIGGQSELWGKKIYPDTEESSTLLNSEEDNPLFAYKDDQYIEIISSNESIITHWGYKNYTQYIVDTSLGILYTTTNLFDDETEGADITSPLGEDLFAVKQINNLRSYYLWTYDDYHGVSGGTYDYHYWYLAESVGDTVHIYYEFGDLEGDTYPDGGAVFGADHHFWMYKIQYSWDALEKVDKNFYYNTLSTYIKYDIDYNLIASNVLADGIDLKISPANDTQSSALIKQVTTDGEYPDLATHENGWVTGLAISSQSLKVGPAGASGNFSTVGSGDCSLDVNNMKRTAYFLSDKFKSQNLFANVIGRLENPAAPEVINHIMENELGQTVGTPLDEYSDWKYAFTVDKKINSKKLIESIASASPFVPRFNNMGEFKFDVIKESYTLTDIGIYDPEDETGSMRIKKDEVISFSYSRTKVEDVKTKVEFKYNWDYGVKDFMSSVNGDDGYSISEDAPVQIEGTAPNITFPTDKNYSRAYYGLTEDADSTLVIDDDRGKYIRDSETAKDFAQWVLRWNCNQHLKMKVKLPLNYLGIEVGEMITFDKVLGNTNPYGINYAYDATFANDPDNIQETYVGDIVNGQQVFPIFMVLSTSKSLTNVTIECIQMHSLIDAFQPVDIELGVTDPDAWNYNPDANFADGTPVYAWEFFTGACPLVYHPTGDPNVEGNDPALMDYSSNFPSDPVDAFGAEIVDFDNLGNIVTNPTTGVFVVNNESDPALLAPHQTDNETPAWTFWDSGTNPVIYLESDCVWEDIIPHTLNFFQLRQESYTYTGGASNIYASTSFDDLSDNSEQNPYIIEVQTLDEMILSIKNGFDVTHPDYGTDNRLRYVVGCAVEPLPTLAGAGVNLKLSYREYSGNNWTLQNWSTPGNWWTFASWNVESASVNPWPFGYYNSLGIFSPDELEAFDSGEAPWQTGSFERDVPLHIYIDSSLTALGDVLTGELNRYITLRFVSPHTMPGDVNDDGLWNVLDIVTLANCILAEVCGEPDNEFGADSDNSDVNQDGLYNVLDIVTLANCILAEDCQHLGN